MTLTDDVAYLLLESNDPSGPHWSDESFLGQLHETGRWNIERYWEFEAALYTLMPLKCNTRKKNANATIVRVFSYSMLMFTCHHNPDDKFTFEDLSNESLHEWQARLQAVVEGYFQELLPSPSSFESDNPLL